MSPGIEHVLEQNLSGDYVGEFLTDLTTRKLYATDASVYQELPIAVAVPRRQQDVRHLIELAKHCNTSLIPRTAGTSLAGQVVGSGIVVDVSRHLNEIIEINTAERWVRVEPGVIRNELNMALKQSGMMFGPETSTASRAMIGGMLGNNSCGSNSMAYGTTRDKVLEIRGFLSDGSKATFGAMDPESLQHLVSSKDKSRQTEIYRGLWKMMSNPDNQRAILANFPETSVTRRNTGYALDALVQTAPFGDFETPFNIAKIIAGSEGTLFFVTEVKLRCEEMSPAFSGVLCAHFKSVDAALRANIVACQFRPTASELIDELVLQGAARNPEQRENMGFLSGMPAAVLLVELHSEDENNLRDRFTKLVDRLKSDKLGYAFPVLYGDQSKPVWEVRRAGLGVVANVVGDTKPVTVIEDAAVSIEKLPDYIAEVDRLLGTKFDTACVHYGHAGSGEIHLRPLLNLKSEQGRQNFKELASDVAKLVKKYKGSLSGEHGDGRLRGQFLREMIGDECYAMVAEVKRLFDPGNIFNPGKIVAAPSMLESLRFPEPTASGRQNNAEIDTFMDFSSTDGVLGAAEMCSGSGDCLKSSLTGGTMCPSYMVTRDEKDSTRGRANLLRHYLTDSSLVKSTELAEVMEVLDLCLSCKGCKRECPSNVDMAKLKAEITHRYQKTNGVPWRSRVMAELSKNLGWASRVPAIYNFLARNGITSHWIKKILGIHGQRRIPLLGEMTLRQWMQSRNGIRSDRKVVLYCDEFTNFFDVAVGKAAVKLLENLGYAVGVVDHVESGRAAISKGMLEKARLIAETNVRQLSGVVSREVPLIGIEPSAILTFRDEYIELVSTQWRPKAQELASHCFLLDEFIAGENANGNLARGLFSDAELKLYYHGHCHQKSLGSLDSVTQMLRMPRNYDVQLIRAGCCGMAGAFGMEREHYEMSMKVGGLALFPAINSLPGDAVVVASGFSCRHQILDGTGRTALHPAQILLRALAS